MFCEKEAQANATETRPPVYFNVTEVSSTSEVTLTFSEQLYGYG
jgi:hypothetical protein